MKKLNKKQLKAVDSVRCMLDELDNKPRRLFSALRELAEAFDEDVETLDSIDEFERFYYTHVSRLNSTVGNLHEQKRKVVRKLLSRSNTKDMKEDEQYYYKMGVQDAARELSMGFLSELFDTEDF